MPWIPPSLRFLHCTHLAFHIDHGEIRARPRTIKTLMPKRFTGLVTCHVHSLPAARKATTDHESSHLPHKDDDEIALPRNSDIFRPNALRTSEPGPQNRPSPGIVERSGILGDIFVGNAIFDVSFQCSLLMGLSRILILACSIIRDGVEHRKLGGDYFHRRNPQRTQLSF